jgi:hypothetical protein
MKKEMVYQINLNLSKNLFLLLCFFSINLSLCYAQKNSLDDKYKRVFQTYSYLTGQNFALQKISKKIPELRPRVNKLSNEFNLKYPSILAILEDYLITKNSKLFEDAKTEIQVKLKETYENSDLSYENATLFLKEVEERINGQISSPFLETILNFQYKDNPHKELIDGYFYTFKTNGHPKSKNTDWQLNIPKSWKSLEADRPNIIQKFISDNGEGNISIMLMVKEIPNITNGKITDSELNEYFTEANMKESIPIGAKFLDYKNITIDGKKGCVVELEQNVERLDFKFKILMYQYSFINDNQLYLLQCSSSPTELNKDDAELSIKKHKQLFQLIANSIVLNSKYFEEEGKTIVPEKISGTGFAITNNGYIATNYHVIKNGNNIKVKGINGNFNSGISCKLIAKDELNDIAILRVDSPNFKLLNNIPYEIKEKISDVGESVFVLGYPLRQSMGDEIKLTNGLISSKTGYAGNEVTYQISAAVQPGNSGCPLFDIEGNIIGIVSAKHPDAENVTYAIKAIYLSNIIMKIQEIEKLNTTNNLKGKSLSEQVKLLENFIYIIETETY